MRVLLPRTRDSPLPVFLIVKVLVRLVPSFTLLKVYLEGDREILGAVFVVPVEGITVKAAVTDLAPARVTWQTVLVVVSQPDHVTAEPVFGTALRVTDVPEARISSQSVPQDIPGPVTEPSPAPDLVTERAY